MNYRTVGRVSWRFEFKPADAWVGVFTRADDPRDGRGRRVRNVWVCLLPMLPLHLCWLIRRERAEA